MPEPIIRIKIAFTFTLSLSHFHFHTFTFTLSHFHFHTFTFTLSHFHTFTFTFVKHRIDTVSWRLFIVLTMTVMTLMTIRVWWLWRGRHPHIGKRKFTYTMFIIIHGQFKFYSKRSCLWFCHVVHFHKTKAMSTPSKHANDLEYSIYTRLIRSLCWRPSCPVCTSGTVYANTDEYEYQYQYEYQ